MTGGKASTRACGHAMATCCGSSERVPTSDHCSWSTGRCRSQSDVGAARVGSSCRGDRVGERSLGRGWRATLTSVADRTLVLDTSTPAMIGPARDPGGGWWFEVFEDRHVHDALDWALDVAQHDARVAVAWTPAVAAAIEHMHARMSLIFRTRSTTGSPIRSFAVTPRRRGRRAGGCCLARPPCSCRQRRPAASWSHTHRTQWCSRTALTWSGSSGPGRDLLTYRRAPYRRLRREARRQARRGPHRRDRRPPA